MYNSIKNIIQESSMKNNIYLFGEKRNPYRYMKNADYLVLSSYHEAAPMVYDEANILGLPIISSNTISAKEMIIDGIINDDFISVIKKLKKREVKQTININNYNKKCSNVFEKIIKE